MLDLYRNCRGLTDRREAFREIQEGLHGLSAPITQSWEQAARQSRENQAKESLRASDEVCDHTYRMMLELLPLREEHRQNLRDRGLKDQQIAAHLFRSTPQGDTRSLAARLQLEGCTLRGVPGFYLDKEGVWQARFSRQNAGYLVPYLSLDEKITGLQVRLDHPKDSCKYLWFSSGNLEGGVSSGSPYHYIGQAGDAVVYLTEGSLKATVANKLLGKSFAAVAGVSQFSTLQKLLLQLKEQGTKTVCDAFDMDKFTNPHVLAARQRMIRMAKEQGFQVYSVTWNPAYKGIDDWALAKKHQQI